MPIGVDDMYDEANREIEEAIAFSDKIHEAMASEGVQETVETMELVVEPNVTVELYGRVGYSYTKSAGWSHKDATVSAKISGVPTEDSDWQAARLNELLKTLSVLTEQTASAEIARRNQLGADGPTSEIVIGDAQGVSDE